MSGHALQEIPKSSRQRRKLAAAEHNAARVGTPATQRKAKPKNDGFDDARIARAVAKRNRKAGIYS